MSRHLSVAAVTFVLASAAPVCAQDVSRAFFTSGPKPVSREPLDSVSTLSSERSGIYFFSEVRGLEGRSITHRWEYQGQVEAEVAFTVYGQRWRVYSYKLLDPTKVGAWTVTVLDDMGTVLASEQLEFVAGAAAPESPAPEAAAEPAVGADPVVSPVPEVSEPVPEISQPVPEVSEPDPEISEPDPEVSEPAPEVTTPDPTPAPPPVVGETAVESAPAPTPLAPSEPVPTEAVPTEPVLAEPAPVPDQAAPSLPAPEETPPRPRLGVRDDPDRLWQQRPR